MSISSFKCKTCGGTRHSTGAHFGSAGVPYARCEDAPRGFKADADPKLLHALERAAQSLGWFLPETPEEVKRMEAGDDAGGAHGRMLDRIATRLERSLSENDPALFKAGWEDDLRRIEEEAEAEMNAPLEMTEEVAASAERTRERLLAIVDEYRRKGGQR